MSDTTILHIVLWTGIAINIGVSVWHTVLMGNTKRKDMVHTLMFQAYSYSAHMIGQYHKMIISGVLPEDDRITEIEAEHDAVDGFMTILENEHDNLVFSTKKFEEFSMEHYDIISRIKMWFFVSGRELKAQSMVENIMNRGKGE